MTKLFIPIILLSLLSVGLQSPQTQYNSGFVVADRYREISFDHKLGYYPSAVYAWCADIFEAPSKEEAKISSIEIADAYGFPVVPCYDFRVGTGDVRITSVTPDTITIYNDTGTIVAVRVVAER